jgi:anti-anti-sigma factor
MNAPSSPQTLDGEPFSMRTVALEGGNVRIEVQGEIDIATSPQLNAGLLRELLARRDVELDLTKVAFMDASALGAILGARRRFERREQSLLVSLRPASQPHHLLTLTGVLPLLAIDDGAPEPPESRGR